MMQQRSLMFIVMAGCWILLFAFVLTFVFQTTKLAKHHRAQDGQSASGAAKHSF
jgi:phosphotransferase system  glucose/maltose/N-acetylglucosamine-specific IIC component